MLPDVEIEFETADDAVIAHVAGEIDMRSAPSFADELMRAHGSGVLHSSVVLDLSEVTFCSSSGVRALLVFCDHCARNAVRIRVVPTPVTRQVLLICGADQVVILMKTVDEALADLQATSE